MVKLVKLNVDDEFLIELGKVTVLFGLIEHGLADLVLTLLAGGSLNHEAGTILTTELSFKQRIGVIESLLMLAAERKLYGENSLIRCDPQGSPETFSQLAADFQKVKAAIFKAEALRNQVVHSAWVVPSAPDGTIRRVKTTAKAKRGLEFQRQDFDLSGLKSLIDEIGAALFALSQFESLVKDSATSGIV